MAIWIWHPEWTEHSKDTAGAFVHFRKTITLTERISTPVNIHITADTKYKLYINSEFVSVGPVKGDRHLWFYDELDIQPYLRLGVNTINVRVLRLYHATTHATSFPRLHVPGLLIRNARLDHELAINIQTDESWEAVIDEITTLPTNILEDAFLHVYEKVGQCMSQPKWVQAKSLVFPTSHGLSAPWKLSPRLIPFPRYEAAAFKAIHNIESSQSRAEWENILLGPDNTNSDGICLPAGSRHHLELEVENHMTALLYFRFQWPEHTGSTMQVTYSECYEDLPDTVPWIRNKGDRCDTRKKLVGPKDEYIIPGITDKNLRNALSYNPNSSDEDVFAPFHFRTFRFLALDITVSALSDLTMKRIDITTTKYPLKVLAYFNVASVDNVYQQMWTTSIRTLSNCMHDCYEDCPFYEQLQYAMDTRSSALFTYCCSGDDRLARQAIIQLHNSYSPEVGLTASRAPAHQLQLIPHFSLFWICMISDHFGYFNDAKFVRQFLPVCDGVLDSFARRIDSTLGLIRLSDSSEQWDFVDWADSWKPLGIPPAAVRTGFASFTNMLYAYTLKRISEVLLSVGRPGVAEEYQLRADATLLALKVHCFDGHFFTDGLASDADCDNDYSQHGQVWAVLSGAATGDLAYDIISECTAVSGSKSFTATSTAMSFYTLRAISMVGGSLYDERFHKFWGPWKEQLSNGLTTWLEDTVSQRSDCHAWGSSPIYEFTTEVAGVRMGTAGWKTMTFHPRVGLFPTLDVKVPFGLPGSSGIAHVHWESEGSTIKVSLSLKMNTGDSANIPIRVVFPDGHEEVIDGAENIELTLNAN
ncbi:Bacterial alpha-L-rhamnosidase [Penicillium expansum]|nr:Bacterial alpha-L-rhamnosidase [Penicillium expansum]KGO72547.1 Bacterial alpha-L-rhamnosidase [Penicillium expansum]